MNNLINRIAIASRRTKRSILLAYDVIAMFFALWASFSVRLGESYWPEGGRIVASASLSIFVGIIALYKLRVYHMVLRFFALQTVSQILFGTAISSIAWSIGIYFTRPLMTVGGIPISVPRSVTFIYFGFSFALLFLGRYLMSIVVSGASHGHPAAEGVKCHHVAIYGANRAGISLARSVRGNPKYQVHAFIDDEKALHGQSLAGHPIYSPEQLELLIRKHSLDEVFLAIPHATRSERLAAISRLDRLNLKVKTVPAPEEIVSGRFTMTDVRPIDVNDLLRRDPVPPLTNLINDAVDNHSIMITGAGGSIGSEICRQLVRGSPRRLVLFDHSEFALYSVDQQLNELVLCKSAGDRPEIIPIIGSVLNQQLIRRTINEWDIDTVYHAAAYKHVPLMESNEIVGVENNVLGTLIVARAALECNLTRFTLISTDKAVRPRSVMGASKRISELILQAFANEPQCSTRFGIVRFGNVLDSSGSVVQKFRDQIQNGGPITVTHEEMTRYFMSIPEATQLVLQASAMARDGEVFVLDMGEPVRIADLARQMIRLTGMTLRDENNGAGDIEIVYVGLRPGEKMSEELFLNSGTLPTSHPRIRMARERFVSAKEILSLLTRLESALKAADPILVRQMINEMISVDGEAQEKAVP